MKRTLLLLILVIFYFGGNFAQSYSNVNNTKVAKLKEYKIDTFVIYRDITHYQELNIFLSNFCDTLNLKLQQYHISNQENIPDSIDNLCNIENIQTLMHIKTKKPVMIYGGVFNPVWLKGMTFDFEIFGKKKNDCILIYKAQLTLSLESLFTETEKIVDKIIQQLIKLKYIETSKVKN
jgi:hypothetical protein